jgi:predicted nicotinamide N-methyase
LFSLETFQRTYDTDVRDIVVGGIRFQFLVPRRIEPFIDSRHPLKDFPLWAKIWQAGLVLAAFLADTPPDPDKRWLEIGSGIGLAGIVAARIGHRVTLTDYNPHALAFARANALLNGCGDLTVRPLDWNDPRDVGRFDYLMGSEVVYKEGDIERLQNLFQSCLLPQGKIYLVEEMRQTLTAFFEQMAPLFHIRLQKKNLRTADATTRVLFVELRQRSADPDSGLI